MNILILFAALCVTSALAIPGCPPQSPNPPKLRSSGWGQPPPPPPPPTKGWAPPTRPPPPPTPPPTKGWTPPPTPPPPPPTKGWTPPTQPPPPPPTQAWGWSSDNSDAGNDASSYYRGGSSGGDRGGGYESAYSKGQEVEFRVRKPASGRVRFEDEYVQKSVQRYNKPVYRSPPEPEPAEPAWVQPQPSGGWGWSESNEN